MFISRVLLVQPSGTQSGSVPFNQPASACDQGRECSNCTLHFRSVNSGMVREVQEVFSGGNANRCWTSTIFFEASKVSKASSVSMPAEVSQDQEKSALMDA